MLNLVAIGERISNRRKELNMTQNQLAETLFVTHQAVSKWENGKSLPTIDILYELTKVLEIPIDYLLDDTDIPADDYQAKLQNYPRDIVLNDFLQQDNWTKKIIDIFYLLTEKERFRVINKLIQKQYCQEIEVIWPYCSKEERIYLLGMILSNKCDFHIQTIYHQLTTQEQRIVQTKKKMEHS